MLTENHENILTLISYFSLFISVVICCLHCMAERQPDLIFARTYSI